MKNIVLISAFFILFSFPTVLYAQVIIGTGKVQPTNASVSLEFGTEEKGIVLPWVTSAQVVKDAGALDGTLIFDLTDKKVKLLANNSWFDFSVLSNGVVDSSLQDPLTENENAKVSIGVPKMPTVNGILVLEDNNKGMVLPQVLSYTNITSPAAGMMVFDTSKKLLCFFNGAKWSFWKPE